jgi:exodeoxyribonuclease V beta subunit
VKTFAPAIFAPQTFPLRGRRLIEASAGTGKTYQIANLFLRLLLEGDRPLTVDQILVVTFTRAATNELRGRIRDKIEIALQGFRQPAATPNDDDFIGTLLQKYPDAEVRASVCQRLNAALVCMDEACIYTIHSFAVQVIQTFLFETGALAEVELTEGDNHRLEQVLGDLWRHLQLNDCEPLRPYIEALGFEDPEVFRHYFRRIPAQAEILPAFHITTPPQALRNLLPQLEQQLKESTASVFAERRSLAARWKKLRSSFEAEVTTGKSGLAVDEVAELVSCIEGWLGNSDTHLKIPARSRRPYNKLNPLAKGEGDLAQWMAAMLEHATNSKPLADYQKNIFLALLAQWLRAALSQTQLSSMQLDDVIRLINKTLDKNNPASNKLRHMITANYPVCLVDECQDTDPEQFELFNRVYGDSEDTGFFMIGDPKQSIYAFRGADIFSYLEVRAQIQADHIFTLGTNFRSKQSLVKATNALFQEESAAKTFIYEGIEFRPVDSCEAEPHRQQKGEYRFGDTPPLVFIGNSSDPEDSSEKHNRTTVQRRYARDAAQRIAALLHRDTGASVTKGEGNPLPLRAADIAILVRSGMEARIMREELMKQHPPILTVYQSQRDSVFSAALFAEDLYHILVAMELPTDKRLLKAAMATPLYRGFRNSFHELDALEQDDVFYEARIAEFNRYRNEWQRHGVLAALGLLMTERKLADAFARQVEGDRLLTDFRHLGELLQQQSQACSSAEELLIWYARQLQDDSGLEADSKRIRLESDENLVKIVTIHVAKGLQYPVVFLPFFFFPRPVKPARDLPFFHFLEGEHYRPRIDFSSAMEDIEPVMTQEVLAEEMRLLYVAITRAVYQCYIGISDSTSSKQPQFIKTVWPRLLGLAETSPSWAVIRQALQQKFTDCEEAVAYAVLGDTVIETGAQAATSVINALVEQVSLPTLPPSRWVLTSYSALAYARRDPGFRHGASDEQGGGPDTMLMEESAEKDNAWRENIRYRLPSSRTTGDCLHGIYETLAQFPDADLRMEVQTQLQRYGLAPEENAEAVADWLAQTLDVPLLSGDHILTLRHLYTQQQALPELSFDFSLGSVAPVSIERGINAVLNRCQVAGISMPGLLEIEGLVTGSLDLLFIHDKKVYVLDYKSNLLGKAPRFYDRPQMDKAMQEHRYDLQYLIYSVAAHRYMQQRLGTAYAFDDKDRKAEYSFGGVFYLFLRGMGLKEFPQQGIWFHRPPAEQILALDAAFKGEGASNA